VPFAGLAAITASRPSFRVVEQNGGATEADQPQERQVVANALTPSTLWSDPPAVWGSGLVARWTRWLRRQRDSKWQFGTV
jgi:hypothetical protein